LVDKLNLVTVFIDHSARRTIRDQACWMNTEEVDIMI
jgi:hypothetical protein